MLDIQFKSFFSKEFSNFNKTELTNVFSGCSLGVFCFPGVVGFDFLDCGIDFPFLGFEKFDPHNILFEY